MGVEISVVIILWMPIYPARGLPILMVDKVAGQKYIMGYLRNLPDIGEFVGSNTI
jgi:hypothetical protein